jgi:hypothetical protein
VNLDFGTGIESPRNRREKFKNIFFGYSNQYLSFGPKNLLGAFSTWYNLQKFLKT